jgi:hypothetical protein
MPARLESLEIAKQCPICGVEIKRTIHSIAASPRTTCVCGAPITFQTAMENELLEDLQQPLKDLEIRIDPFTDDHEEQTTSS